MRLRAAGGGQESELERTRSTWQEVEEESGRGWRGLPRSQEGGGGVRREVESVRVVSEKEHEKVLNLLALLVQKHEY